MFVRSGILAASILLSVTSCAAPSLEDAQRHVMPLGQTSFAQYAADAKAWIGANRSFVLDTDEGRKMELEANLPKEYRPEHSEDVYKRQGLALAVAAPSRQWVTNEGGIDWALRRRAFSAAEALGFRVRELEGTYLEEARFAGPDAVRAGDLPCALTELDADLVMAMRGGYGCGRILDMLDWERIGAASTPFVGFSDVTAFELALLARTGRTSWQGPTLRDLIDPDPLTIEGLLAVVGRRPFASTWQSDDTDDADAEGVLWGGNLAMIASLAGTPWMPQVENGILFIEDVACLLYTSRCV